MKKIVHKNQVVITTLAVLIAIAGYVTYDRKSDDGNETAKTVANVESNVNGNDLEEDYNIQTDISDEDMVASASTENVENPGETVLTSAGVGDSDYAAKVKLNREQVRSKNRETLQAIIDNEALDEAQKQAAVDEMIT